MMAHSLKFSLARAAAAMAVLALGIAGAADARAQFGGGGPQLEPAKAEAAWKLQSGIVAKQLGVKGDGASKLEAAYIAARKSHGDAMAKLREETGGDRMAMMQGAQEVIGTERGKFEEAVKGTLTPEQTTKALGSLGALSGEWDRHVDTLAGFGLDGAKMDEALGATVTYVEGTTKAMEEAMSTMDFESVRTARQELKGKLDEALGKILNDEQKAKWAEATTRRGRGGRGGPGGEGRQGGPGGGEGRPGGPGGAPQN